MNEPKPELKEKTIYLFGQVTVDIMTVKAESKEKGWDAAVKMWKADIKSSKEGPRKIFSLQWAEGGELSTETARNNVLYSFLQMMSKMIPPTKSVEASRIIIPTEFDNTGEPKNGQIVPPNIFKPPGS